MSRRDKENYYLDIAQTVAERGTCLRRNFGAISLIPQTGLFPRRGKPPCLSWMPQKKGNWLSKMRVN